MPLPADKYGRHSSFLDQYWQPDSFAKLETAALHNAAPHHNLPQLCSGQDVALLLLALDLQPGGRIQQIEFAGKAVDNGPPCAAITTSDGVYWRKRIRRATKHA